MPTGSVLAREIRPATGAPEAVATEADLEARLKEIGEDASLSDLARQALVRPTRLLRKPLQ